MNDGRNLIKSGKAATILSNARAKRKQATQVAIYRVGLKSVITYADADKVASTIERLEKLNPGKKYETR